MNLKSPWDRPEVLAKLAATFQSSSIKSLILPNAAEPAAPPATFEAFFVADRGRYELADLPEPVGLRTAAEALCGRRLLHATTRVVRLKPGGYALFLDDERTRIPESVEVTVDLSERSAGPAVEYRSASEKLLVPQLPGLVAFVQRDPTVWRCDRYLPRTAGEIPVLRLRATFRFAD